MPTKAAAELPADTTAEPDPDSGGTSYVIVTTTQSCRRVTFAEVLLPVLGAAPMRSLIWSVEASDRPVI